MPVPLVLRRALPGALAALALASAAAAAQRPLPATRPVPAPRPPAPASVRAEAVGSDAVRITWTAVPGATAYELGRLVPPSGWQRVARVGAVTEHVDAGRDLASPHVYSVVAVVSDVASMRAMSDTVGGAARGRAASSPDGDGSNGGGGAGASGASGSGTGGSKDARATAPDPLAPVGCSRLDAEFTRCTGAPVAWSPRRDVVVVAEVACPGGAVAVGGGHVGEFPYGVLAESAPTAAGWRVSVAPIWFRRDAVAGGTQDSGGSDGKAGSGRLGGIVPGAAIGAPVRGVASGAAVLGPQLPDDTYAGLVQAHVVCRRPSGE